MDKLQPVTNRQSVYGNHNINGWKHSNALGSVLKLTSIEIFFQRQTWLYIKHTLPINSSLPQSRMTHRSSCRHSVVCTHEFHCTLVSLFFIGISFCFQPHFTLFQCHDTVFFAFKTNKRWRIRIPYVLYVKSNATVSCFMVVVTPWECEKNE